MSSSYPIADSWGSPLAVADLHRLLIAKVAARGGSVLRASAGEIHAEFGSLLTYKFKGARFTKPHAFPLRATMRLTAEPGGTRVRITAEGGFGAGLRMGIGRGHAERAMEELLRFLRADLAIAAPVGGSARSSTSDLARNGTVPSWMGRTP